LLLRKRTARRAELRCECGSVRCEPAEARPFRALRASSTERRAVGRAARDPWGPRISLEFAVLDTRLNHRLSGWMCSFVWAPTGRSRMVRRLCSNVV